MNTIIDTITTKNQEAYTWRLVLSGLAGALPPSNLTDDDAAEIREGMKLHATVLRDIASPPMHASFRAPGWVLHAFSHWWRAWASIQQWSEIRYTEEFPYGLSFRKYLGAWIWSVGIPQLGMTPADLEAVHEMTGVAALPHPLLPRGHSEFITGIPQTSEVDKIQARNLTLESLMSAVEKSRAR